jgi:hypothetical protein
MVFGVIGKGYKLGPCMLEDNPDYERYNVVLANFKRDVQDVWDSMGQDRVDKLVNSDEGRIEARSSVGAKTIQSNLSSDFSTVIARIPREATFQFRAKLMTADQAANLGIERTCRPPKRSGIQRSNHLSASWCSR